VAEKSGPNDLVTVADTEAEAFITQALARDWPGVPVLGEEGVALDARLRLAMGTDDLVVIVDPVDGTWNFASGLSIFGILLAVVEKGQPIWGMLYDPICDDWIKAASGQPSQMISSHGAVTLRTAAPKPPEALSGYLPLGLYPAAQKRTGALAGLAYARVTSLRCTAHEYRTLVQGHVDFLLSSPLPHPWDHAAGVLAVQGAGGVARFLDGGAYDTARVEGTLLAASCEEVWQQVAQDFAALA
jgi:fructose-1,6-bisphosphatase/inositol monophosphatase family enzyme